MGFKTQLASHYIKKFNANLEHSVVMYNFIDHNTLESCLSLVILPNLRLVESLVIYVACCCCDEGLMLLLLC